MEEPKATVVSDNARVVDDQVASDGAESCTTTRSSTPPASPQLPVQNPWAKITPANSQEVHLTNLSSIMAQQEKDSALSAKRQSTIRFEENVTNIPDEEEMIRLAIEASLKDSNPSLSEELDSEEIVDEDLKLALQLSVAELSDSNMPYDSESLDRKKPALSGSDFHEKKQGIEASVGIHSEEILGDFTTAQFGSAHTEAAAAFSSLAASAASSTSFLTEEEQQQITRAIIEADDKAQAESLKLAMEIQQEEDKEFERMKVDQIKNNAAKSNVRTVTKAEFDYNRPETNWTVESRQLWGQDNYDDHQEQYEQEIRFQEFEQSSGTSNYPSGYQMNSSTPSKDWSRLDKNTIVGPNNELRTKHDVFLKNQSNADRLLGAKSNVAKRGGNLSVSDKAFNSFNQTLKNSMKRGMVKGVERSGTGRAENMNEKTRGGAMDGNVRLLITKAINNGLIQHCNGIVKEGKEAVIYHAESGTQSEGFDVAIKVFKRIQEFKNRHLYIDEDPRYFGKKFRNADKREQVELWTEKEYRNLVRAQRAGVAVPTPLMQKDNVLFMRFLGDGGWPAAQLREVELKKGSRKWTILYIQTIVAMRRLYHCARLIHGDLSEFNVLVCPMSQVENAMDKTEEAGDNLQIVLIDFGQAVERKHPSASDLLNRDITQINNFFVKQGVVTMSDDECLDFIVEEMKKEECDSSDDEKGSIDGDEQEIIGELRFNIEGWSDEKDLQRLEAMVKAKKQSLKKMLLVDHT